MRICLDYIEYTYQVSYVVVVSRVGVRKEVVVLYSKLNISDESWWGLSCKLTAGGEGGGRPGWPLQLRHTVRLGQQFEGTKKPRRVTNTN